jgi:hypothetical protein
MAKTALTISRHWHAPEIYSQVSGEGIAIALAWDDVVKALIEELYAQGRWMSKTQLEQKVQQAAKNVLDKVKEESHKVV